jgi:hypothetical protein
MVSVTWRGYLSVTWRGYGTCIEQETIVCFYTTSDSSSANWWNHTGKRTGCVDVLPCTRITIWWSSLITENGLWIWDENSITGPWKKCAPSFCDISYFIQSLLLHVKVSPPRSFLFINTKIHSSPAIKKKHSKVSLAKCPFWNCRLIVARYFEPAGELRCIFMYVSGFRHADRLLSLKIHYSCRSLNRTIVLGISTFPSTPAAWQDPIEG